VAALALSAGACGHPTAPEVFARPQPVDTSRVRIVIPAVYELANVIIAMTSYGQNSPSLIHRSGPYYQRVYAAFSAFRSHASMRDLQLGTGDPLRRYYEFRDNSYAYVYEDGEIRRDPDAIALRSPNIFRDRLSAVQTFADASQFRSFFAANEAYYVDLIDRYRSAAQVDSMADWLEREFPGVRYRQYTVVLSPLVYASHSAYFPPGSSQAYFFVSGPDVTTGAGTSDGVKKATVQRILFTELDHAFVNPVTDRYRTAITGAFADRAKWTTDTSTFYDSPTAVFNEYMTWAVFLLFVSARLSQPDFEAVRQMTVQLMETTRRFHRFGPFTDQLLQLRRTGATALTVADLYPQIIEWASTFSGRPAI
jgi:hypothetical protein